MGNQIMLSMTIRFVNGINFKKISVQTKIVTTTRIN